MHLNRSEWHVLFLSAWILFVKKKDQFNYTSLHFLNTQRPIWFSKQDWFAFASFTKGSLLETWGRFPPFYKDSHKREKCAVDG